MDVGSSINRSLALGLSSKNAIQNIVKSLDIDGSTIEELVEGTRTKLNDELKTDLISAIAGGGERGGLSNLVETVRYSLTARDGTNSVDNYGLLRTVKRRFTHVSPGAEWIVVMSALASRGPSSVLRLGDLIQHLNGLGFQPRIDFLLAELEKAGLCASAADGDEGIEIDLGFGEA
jgi:hypothetical protein